MAKAISRNAQIKLGKALVLNRWILSQFGVYALESLADSEFKRSVSEGMDADNCTHYYHQLALRQYTFPGVSTAQLLAWDQNIVSHTLAISAHRDAPIRWKYFQYLGLLFTELYLERYFTGRAALLESLNEYVRRWNQTDDTQVPDTANFHCELFTEKDLNKIAFWSATGSGKTLLMHVNILQYRYYSKLYGKPGDLNKVLLVTPNEGLSAQHLEELEASGIDAEIFSKSSGAMFSGNKVEIIEISKLSETSGDKTVAVDAFESNNLVLIDEGHRGMGGDEWKDRRDALSATGFAFEYSATFGQAVSAAAGEKKKKLTQEYAKSILMDYSYKYFYNDGYGKDYNILNIPSDEQQSFVRIYLTGALLSYYQQLLVFAQHPNWAPTYLVQKPLWVFVGGSVNAVRKEGGKEMSDVVRIIDFFSGFIKDGPTARANLKAFLEGTDGVLDQQGRSVFAGRFSYLKQQQPNVDSLYHDILRQVFQSDTPGADIYVDHLKGQDGELGIRLGDRYFGVVNVGDAPALFKLCQARNIPGETLDFSDSLFQQINRKDTSINLLIGSKKFTEGWSSWRVSAMGLMNIGRSEGAQIIQLFGRGVRLKGYQMSLKRSSMLDQDQRPGEAIPKELRILETLQIFGVRADYMQQFREFLLAEGLPANDSNFTPVEIPQMLTTELGRIKLKVLMPVKDTSDFKRERIVTLKYDGLIGRGNVHLEWYPKVEVMRGSSQEAGLPDTQSQKLSAMHLAFIDWTQVFFALQRHKAERGWQNLKIDLPALKEIIAETSWYELAIPQGELEPTSFACTREWQQIVIALLKGYVDRYYNLLKSGYLGSHLETVELTPDHPNFSEMYQMDIAQSEEALAKDLIHIAELLRKGQEVVLDKVRPGLTVFTFLQHLYKPLIHLDARKFKDIVHMSPVGLVESEYDFVQHLMKYYEQNQPFFKERQLYLLRNTSRKGIGFFEASGFYPDFLLWIVEKDHQHICFIDPKGLRQVSGMDNFKIQFYKRIKEIELDVRQRDPDISLHSFIITPTSHDEVKHWHGGGNISDFNKHNVYFMKEQQASYIHSILQKVIEPVAQAANL